MSKYARTYKIKKLKIKIIKVKAKYDEQNKIYSMNNIFKINYARNHIISKRSTAQGFHQYNLKHQKY